MRRARKGIIMINYRQNKKRYKPNELGSLYVDESKLNPHEQPVIYIGGQMEHRCHILEQTGLTGDQGHNMFTGSWFYDYPIFSKNKGSYNATNFTNNLLESLQAANLHDVILITESYGGTIASLATKSDLISKAVAIHPSILGTSLANPYYLEDFKQYFNKRQLLILKALKVAINPEYGFEQDNFNGINLRNVDFDKLLVVGSYINQETETNPILLETSDMIQKVTSNRNDGVVVFEPREFERLGILYLQEDEHNNHLAAGTKEHIAKVYQKTLK